MLNSEKNELARRVKDIPETELNKPISDLWRRYAPLYSYQTFRNYLRAFKHLPLPPKPKGMGFRSENL
jgi:hypothetical protein